MTKMGLHSFILLLAVGLCQFCLAQQTAPSEEPAQAATEEELNPQLKLTKDALLNKGSSEQMRMNAVAVLLGSEDSRARGIVLDALSQDTNQAARIAICRVLAQTRTGSGSVENAEQFIKPLLEIVAQEQQAVAALAAEALLIFEFEQVSGPLEALALDDSAPLETRLNAIQALELHPDMRVAVKLLELVDSGEPGIAAAARRGLNVLGVPVGKSAADREQIIARLRANGQEAYLREQLIRQRSEIASRKVESNLWQGRYLAAQDQLCDSIAEDGAKGKFLANHLTATEPTTRLWALEKLRQLRLSGKTSPKLTAEVGKALVGLISDPNRLVRLKTAEVLSLMGQVNSAERLLAQLEVEEDEEVRVSLFSALGGACYYAFLDSSPFDIPVEVRMKALEWAAKYVFDEDPEKAQRGAAVLARLLEQDGLTDEQVEGYLSVLSKRYTDQKGRADGSLRAELVGSMAALCAQGVHSTQARQFFKPVFDDALSDDVDRVREKAVDGLIYINKEAALDRLRADFTDDASARIRRRLIELAGEVGGGQDLPWLERKLGVNGEGEAAWQAMMKIFAGAEPGVVKVWVERLAGADSQSRLSHEQRINFLETAERRLTNDNGAGGLARTRALLVPLYLDAGQFEKAAACLTRWQEAAGGETNDSQLRAARLETYLRWGKPEEVAALLAGVLRKGDIDPNDLLLQRLDAHMSKPPDKADPNDVLVALTKVEIPETRPKWEQWLKSWVLRLGGEKAAEEPKGSVEPQKG